VKVDRGRPQARNVIPGAMTNFDSRNVVPSGAAAVVYQQPVATAYQQPVATAYQQPAGGTPAAPSIHNGAVSGLPTGWSSALDPSSGRPYYIDPEGKSHWTPPSTGASPTGSAASPTATTAAAYQSATAVSSALYQQYPQQSQWGGMQVSAQWMQTPQYCMAGAQSPTRGATAATAIDAPMQTWEHGGTVKSFSTVNLYGFIIPDGGGNDVFVHQREIVAGDPGGSTLRRGQRVFYTPGQQNGKLQAKSVRSAPDQNTAPEATSQATIHTPDDAAAAMEQWKAAMQYNDAAQTAGETVPDAGNALKEWQAAAGCAAATGILQGVAMVAAKVIATGDFSIQDRKDEHTQQQQAPPAAPSDLQGPPPAGLQGPPPPGLQGPPPAGLQGPPPAGLQGPPPAGLQGPPPAGLQGPPPAGLQGPPPAGLQGQPPAGPQASPSGGVGT
jgi:cold shock CspA family protein